jgi:hypothetical protein
MNKGKQMRKRMPKGFRKGHDESIKCPHRDVSCCPNCAKANEEIVEVYGRHFWICDQVERMELTANMKI